MDVTINIDDYLTEEEKKLEAASVWRSIVASTIKDEAEVRRVLSNTAYDIVHKTVDEMMGEDTKEIIAKEVKRIISKKDSLQYAIFKKPDVWDREPNDAYRHLQKCIEAQFPTIEKVVKETVEKQTLDTLRSDIEYYIIDAVQNLYKQTEGK